MFKKIYYLLLFIFSIISIYLGFNSTIIPNKLLYLTILFYIVFLFIIIILLSRKNKLLITLGIIFSIPLLIGNVSLCYVYSRTNTFFNKITNVEYETSNYSVIVLKDSTYTKIEELKQIGLYKQDIDKNYEQAVEELNDRATIDNKRYDNLLTIINDCPSISTIAYAFDSIFFAVYLYSLLAIIFFRGFIWIVIVNDYI